MNKGIWIDNSRAWISAWASNEQTFMEMLSNVEDTHPAGGYGGRVPYGPQNAHPEDKVKNRKAHQFNAFFNSIAKELRGVNHLLVEGPASAKHGLLKALQEDSLFNKTVINVRVSDSKTKNQFLAGVRNYFEAEEEKMQE